MRCTWMVSGLLAMSLLGSVLAAPKAAPTVRERLVRVAAASRDLERKSVALAEGDLEMLSVEPMAPDDRREGAAPRFARASQVAAYAQLRPWSPAYIHGRSWKAPAAPVEEWPTRTDAGALRKLLQDPDASVRSLAIDALGSLGQPEDVPRIAALLEDRAVGAVALGWSMPRSAMLWRSPDADPVDPERTWHERMVGTYAREALKVMTGHRFDGQYPVTVTFAEWWKTHNLGKSALWYWQQRLEREDWAARMIAPKAGEPNDEFRKRREEASRLYREALHKASIAELRKLPADVQWKVFLLTHKNAGESLVEGPVNSFFPEGIDTALSPTRFAQLAEGTNLWPDMADGRDGRSLMLVRLARIADQITRDYEAPMAAKQVLVKALETELVGQYWRPMLVSRLLRPAPPGSLDDPTYREGYLRKALAQATDRLGYEQDYTAAEMVRCNIEAQWPVLEKVFYSEKRIADSDARIGILKALGEKPHTTEKTRRLVELINDPRNEALFTMPDYTARAYRYRQHAVRGLNSIAGTESAPHYVSSNVLANLGKPTESAAALAELRRLADALLKRSRP